MNYTDLIDQIEQSPDENHAEQIYRDNINANGFDDYQKGKIHEALQRTLESLRADG